MAIITDQMTHFYLMDFNSPPLDLVGGAGAVDFAVQLGAPTFNPGGAINGSVDFNQVTDGYQTGSGDIWVQPGGAGSVSFTISTWMRPDALGGGVQQVFLLQGAASTFGSWALFCDGTDDQIKFTVRSAVSGLEVQVAATDHGALTAGTWYLVVAWLDGVTGEQGIAVNGVETINPVPHDGSMAADANTTVTMARHPTQTISSFDGRMDQTAVWSTRALAPHERSRLYNGGAPLNLELWTRLTHYYQMESTSTPEPNHVNPGSNDLAYAGGTPASVAGKFGQGLQFDVNQVLFAPDLVPTGVAGSSFTVAAWVNLAALAGAGVQQVVAHQGSNSTNREWKLFYDGDNSTFVFGFRPNGGVNTDHVGTTLSGLISTGVFGLVVARLDGTAGTAMVGWDNTTQTGGGTTLGLHPIASAGVGVGRHRGTGIGILNGVLDDLLIWDRALSDSALTELYGAGAGTDMLLGFPVAPPNIPPVATNFSGPTPHATAIVIDMTLLITDADGTVDFATVDLDTVTSGIQASVVVGGEGSWVSDGAGSVTFTPELGFVGAANRDYTALDDAGDPSNVATLTVTVAAANVPPVATNFSGPTAHATAIIIDMTLLVTDADGTVDFATVDLDTVNPGIDASVVIGGEGSWVSNGAGSVTFTPELGFTGVATRDYTALDNVGAISNVAQLQVTVAAANIPPVATNFSGPTPHATAIIIDMTTLVTDADGTVDFATVDLDTVNPGIDASVVVGGEGSWVSNGAGSVTFTPEVGFAGVATRNYTALDNVGAISNVAQLEITVAAANVPPVATNFSGPTAHATAIIIDMTLLVTDADGTVDFATVDLDTVNPGIDASVVIGGEGSWVSNGAGSVTFTPEPGFTGNAVRDYTAMDNAGDPSNTATLTVTVAAAAPPSIANATIGTTQGVAGQVNITPFITAGDNPVDFGSADLDLVTAGNQVSIVFPTEGTWTYDQGTTTITFTPLPAFLGTSLLPYTIADTFGNVSAAGTVQATVSAVGGGGAGATELQLLRRRRRA